MARKIIYKNGGLNNQPDSPIGYKFVGYDNDIFSEKDGSVISAIGGSGGSNIIEKTYLELTTMISNSELDPGQLYLMTDFQTIYDQPDYNGWWSPKETVSTITSSVMPILCLATSDNTIAKEVHRPSTPKQILHYDIEFDETEIMSSPAKGRIIYCKDENGNETTYDHTLILFKRYETIDNSGVFDSYFDTGYNSDEFLTFGSNCINNKIDKYIKGQYEDFILNNNVIGSNSIGNYLGIDNMNNTLGNHSTYNKIGDYSIGNIIGNGSESNTYDYYTIHNIFGNSCKYNTFSRGLEENIFGNNTNSNIFTAGTIYGYNFGDTFVNNYMQYSGDSIDFTNATHVKEWYPCTISSTPNGTAKLSYINDLSVLTVVDPTE